MRAALWADEDREEHAREIERFLTAPDPVQLPILHAVFVCARATGGLCGFVEVSIRAYAEGCETDRVGYIEGWYVDPDQRRRGIGRLLVTTAEAWARAQGCLEMASDAELANRRSEEAHRRLGYVEVGRSIHFMKPLAA